MCDLFIAFSGVRLPHTFGVSVVFFHDDGKKGLLPAYCTVSPTWRALDDTTCYTRHRHGKTRGAKAHLRHVLPY